MNLDASYYRATATPFAPCPPLVGHARADVAIVGGGLTGLSAALALSQLGYRVAVLEAETVGYGASGRAGGQILPGFGASMGTITRQRGPIAGRDLWWLSVAAVERVAELVAQYQIDCDFHHGALAAAITPAQEHQLIHDMDALIDQFDFFDMQFLDKPALSNYVNSPRYRAGLYFPQAAHLHPLNFTFGLAKAAQNAGAVIYESSRAVSFDFQKPASITTATGKLTAEFVVLAGNAYLQELAPLWDYVMPVGTYMIATVPIAESRLIECLPKPLAIYDLNCVLDYFRLTGDRRILFGGLASYSANPPPDLAAQLQANLHRVFPQLLDVKAEFSWGGNIAITQSRAPHFGYLHPHVLFAQGYSGHGLALATLAGELMANAIRGQAEQFDLLAQFRHWPFPGGRYLRRPLLTLAMSYFRLRDRLGF